MMRSRGCSAMFAGECRIAQRRAERSAESIDDAPVRRQFAPDQNVVEVGIGPQLVDRADDVGEPQALAPGDRAGTKHVTFERHALIERRAQPQHAQRIAAAQQLAAPPGGRRAAR